jgi:hypothetical protein
MSSAPLDFYYAIESAHPSRAVAMIAARDADIRRSTLLEAIEKLEILAGSPLGDGVTEAALRMGADRLRQLLPAAPAAERSDADGSR